MRRTHLAYLSLSLILLGSCLHSPQGSQVDPFPASLNHFYDYQLISSATQKAISIEQLVLELASRDVIFVGELHSHSASHYLQLQLLAALYQNNTKLILSMEQFSRDKQALLDQYLAGEIGEQTLIHQGDAWPNYPSDYRPLVEFAKAHHLAVIAANAPQPLVRCIALNGPAVVDKLPDQQRAYLAKDFMQSSVAYQEKFHRFLGRSHGTHGALNPQNGAKEGGLSNIFYAQLAWDHTMAESIARALDANPDHQVMAINGAFHSDDKLGTVEALQRLRPHLKISVISPYGVTAETIDMAAVTVRGDYIYTVQRIPQRYVQKAHRGRSAAVGRKREKPQQCVW